MREYFRSINVVVAEPGGVIESRESLKVSAELMVLKV